MAWGVGGGRMLYPKSPIKCPIIIMMMTWSNIGPKSEIVVLISQSQYSDFSGQAKDCPKTSFKPLYMLWYY